MLEAVSESEKTGIEEQYSSATHASNLKLEYHRKMPVDTVIAAGWSRSRVGAGLLRLHSEHDGAEKPQKASPEHIEALAASFRAQDAEAAANRRRENGELDRLRGELAKLKPDNPLYEGILEAIADQENLYAQGRLPLPELAPPQPALPRAKAEAARWLEHERKLQFQKLKSLPDVRRELIAWCARVGISGGAHKVAALLSWWLDPTCRGCDGQKWQVIEGTARHSGKACKECQGTGEAWLPHGNDGRKIERYINDCLQAARASIGRNLHARGNQLHKK